MTEQSKTDEFVPGAVLDGQTCAPNECSRICPCCGRHLEWGWTYCPSCGCWVFQYPYRPCYPAYPTPYQPTYQRIWMQGCVIPCAY